MAKDQVKETAAQKRKRLAAEKKNEKLKKEQELKAAEEAAAAAEATAENAEQTEGSDKAPEEEGKSEGDAPAEDTEQEQAPEGTVKEGESFPVKEDDVEEPVVIGAAGNDRSPQYKLVVIAIDEYIDTMNFQNGRSQHEQMLKQIRLFRALQSVFMLQGDELKDGLEYIDNAFKTNPANVFSKEIAFRNVDQIALSSKEIQAFTALLHLFMKSAAVGRGNVHKTIDVPMLEEKMTNKKAAEIAIQLFSKQAN